MMDRYWDTVLLIKRLYDIDMQPICEQYNVSRMELDILLFLANNPEYRTARDIIRRRGLTKSHVSTSVKNLIVHGYLQTSYKDGNKKTIYLTPLPPAGELTAAGQEAQKAFFQTIFGGFTPEEIQTMRDRMDRVADNIREKLKEER